MDSEKKKKTKRQKSIRYLTRSTGSIHAWPLVWWRQWRLLEHVRILGDNLSNAIQNTAIVLIVETSVNRGFKQLHLTLRQRMIIGFDLHQLINIGGIIQLDVCGQPGLLDDTVDLANEWLDLLEQCILRHCE